MADGKQAKEAFHQIPAAAPAKDGRIPRWVLTGVVAAIKAGTLPPSESPMPTAGEAIDHVTDSLGMTLAEHTGRVKMDEFELLVLEPYAERLNAKSLLVVERFAEAMGCAYFVTPYSQHFPSRTVRIVIGSDDAVRYYRAYEHFDRTDKPRLIEA